MDTKTRSATGNADLDAVREDLAALRQDFAALIAHLKDGGVAQDAAQRVREKAGSLYEEIGERGHRSAEAMRHQVEERPLTAIALAFALGFIGGRLLSR
jgi:ElaB/YqjD/DUF883 family membrane-anchored ribosome-binding protein